MKLLLDSDFLIALYKKDDSNHEKSNKILEQIYNKENLVLLELVVQESSTVISKRIGMKDTKIFYKSILKIANQVIPPEDSLLKKSWEIFLKQTKKGTSFVDCANLAAIEKYKLDGIVSFDKFYPLDKNFTSRYK